MYYILTGCRQPDLIEKTDSVEWWRTNKVAEALSMNSPDSPGNLQRSKCVNACGLY